MVDLKMLRDKFGLTQENLKQWLYTDLNMDPGNVKGVKSRRMRAASITRQGQDGRADGRPRRHA